MGKGDLFGKIANGVRSFSGVLRGGLVSGLRLAGVEFRSFSMSMLMNPVGLAVAGIAAAGYLIYTNWDKIKTFFAGFWTGIKPAWNAMKPIFSSLGNAFAPLTGALGRLWDWFVKLFPATLNWNEVGRIAGQVVGNYLVPPLAMAVDGLAKLVSWIGTGIGWLWDLGQTLFNFGNNTGKALYSAMSNAGAAISNGISNIWNTITSTVSNWGNVAWNWGKNIVDGIAGGIRSAAAAVTSAMSWIAGKVSGGFTTPMQIKSPSRLFHQYGGFLMEGLEAGISNKAGGVLKSVGNMARAVSLSGAIALPNVATGAMPKMPTVPQTPTIARSTTGGGGIRALQAMSMPMPQIQVQVPSAFNLPNNAFNLPSTQQGLQAKANTLQGASISQKALQAKPAISGGDVFHYQVTVNIKGSTNMGGDEIERRVYDALRRLDNDKARRSFK